MFKFKGTGGCTSNPDSPASSSKTFQLALNNNANDSQGNSSRSQSFRSDHAVVPHVYFMIGCQRSGSNWLRTILGEREDLVAPHPPHIMRDFLPILPKFGDLDNVENLKILVDHVCTMVECNQVQWNDKHNQPIKFDRQDITTNAIITVKVLRSVQLWNQRYDQQENLLDTYTQTTRKQFTTIDDKYYLLAIFDEVMNYCAKANDKHTWICKSMGMSKYHDMLLTFYGRERLRYIYLVRDPRDVTLSFMNTPVGDCHPYSVSKKWTKLQEYAQYIKANNPELLHEVRYEDVIQNKVEEVAKINAFIGETRRTGKMMRRGSVIVIKDEDRMMRDSCRSHEATKAAALSYQFKNLTKGDEFTKNQFQKWRREMKDDDARIVELVAKDQMKLLGYECYFIDEKQAGVGFDVGEIDDFERENRRLVEEMNNNLKSQNPEDFERRLKQSSVLKLHPSYITESFVDTICDLDELDAREDQQSSRSSMISLLSHPMVAEHEDHDFRSWPKHAERFGFIHENEVDIHVTETQYFKLASGRHLHIAAASQAGYYPQRRDKKNQDCFLCGVVNIKEDDGMSSANLTSRNDGILFSVFDGHGLNGTECSHFVRDMIREYFGGNSLSLNGCKQQSVEDQFRSAYETVNKHLIENRDIDSSQSGTTALSLYITNDTFHVANVGDSRCIAVSSVKEVDHGSLKEGRSDYKVEVLSEDQTLERLDEMCRIESHGGLVMTSEEFDARASHIMLSTSSTNKKLNNSSIHTVSTMNSSIHTVSTLNNSIHALNNSIHTVSTMNNSIHTVSTMIDIDEPLRVWAQGSGKKLPGCAFTRSLGDDIAKTLGVIAEPEYSQCNIRDDHEMFILASDGVFDFVSNEQAAEIVRGCESPNEACRALIGLAYARWIDSEERADDITVMVGILK